MVERSELSLLRGFGAGEHIALSVYLDLSTPERRGTALQRLEAALTPQLSGNDGIPPEQAAELQEDMDMVRLYLKSSNGARAPYLAAFSCAPELFWRVYQLDAPVGEMVALQRTFHLGPLEEALRCLPESAHVRSRENDLQPHLDCASL